MNVRARRGLLAAAFALLPAVAFATVVIERSLEEMAKVSPVVVRGTVGQVQARWDDQAPNRIETWAEVQVLDGIKGAREGSMLLVKQPGGIIGNFGQHVSGVAQFTPGQDTLLFLEPAVDAPGAYLVVALAAGKVDFEASPKTGEVRAVRRLGGLGFARPAGEAPAVRRLDAAGVEDLGTPKALLDRVKAAVRRASK